LVIGNWRLGRPEGEAVPLFHVVILAFRQYNLFHDAESKMLSKPLVVRYDIQGVPFAVQFLGADDFYVPTLKHVCRDLAC